MSQEKRIHNLENRRSEKYLQIIAICTSLIVLTILSLLFYAIRQILGIFVLAFLFSYIVSPAVRYLERRGFSRFLTVGLLYLAFVAIVVVSAVVFLPMLWNELVTLQFNIQDSLSNPEFGKNLMSKIETFQDNLSSNFPMFENLDLKSQLNIDKGLSGVISWILNYIGQMVKTITSYSGKIILIILLISLIPFITFFILKDGRSIKQAMLKIIPNRYNKITVELLQTIDRRIGRFIRGRIAESIILSILTMIGLRVLNIKYALVIGAIAGFANLVPYIGPVGIAIPPVLLALYQYGVSHAVITAVFLIVLQVIDNLILIPFIVGKSVDLHPLITIFVILVGGKTLGLLGLVAAVPIASILISIAQAVYSEFKNFSEREY